MAFYCNPHRETNQAGDVVAVGVKWNEGHREGLNVIGGALGVSFLVGLFAAGIINGLTGTGNVWSGLSLSALLAVPALCMFGLYKFGLFSPRKKEIIFSADDKTSISATHYYPNFPPSQITSIQFRRDETFKPEEAPKYRKSHVIFLNEGGDVENIAQNLDEDEAIKLTTQLNKALNEIRAAMAVKTTVKDGVLHVEINADAFDDIDPMAPSASGA